MIGHLIFVLLLGALAVVVGQRNRLRADRDKALADVRHLAMERTSLRDFVIRQGARCERLTDLYENEAVHARALGETLGDVNRRLVASQRTVTFLLTKMVEHGL